MARILFQPFEIIVIVSSASKEFCRHTVHRSEWEENSCRGVRTRTSHKFKDITLFAVPRFLFKDFVYKHN